VGGVHPTLYPEESISFVDAICVGEGERPLELFLKNALIGDFKTDVPGMWFRKEGRFIRTRCFPWTRPIRSEECLIPILGLADLWHVQKSIQGLDHLDYANYNGLLFRTLWTLGCPFSCAYCANDSFIKLDPGYRKLRHPPWITLSKKSKSRWKNTNSSLPSRFTTIISSLFPRIHQGFCGKYKKEVGLPFVVFGMHPNLIIKEKVEMLAEAGMNRARMGIQSGSQNTLKFFNRVTVLKTS